ncbi:MAG TPA: PIN domain-containing protein, partial [Burkholderiales bacterium]
LRRAADLSLEYTADIGCRSLDVLHVACALELGLPNFLTFDLRQRRLVRSVGLKAVSLRT